MLLDSSFILEGDALEEVVMRGLREVFVSWRGRDGFAAAQLPF